MTTTRRIFRTALIVLLVPMLASPAWSQRNKKKTFAETTSVVAVEVPVTVIRSGKSVDDLTAENFEILDGKKKQKITGFEVIDLQQIDSLERIEEGVPIAARRHFLMLFDLAWSRPESVVKARRAARDLVDSLHPMDLAGVAVYTSTKGANLILSFTSDRSQIELAIETLGVPELYEATPDPLGLVFGSARDFGGENTLSDSVSEAGRAEEIQGIKQESILDAVARISEAEMTAQLNKLSAFTGNLEALADLMATIDGRKHVVYFSEGIPNELLVGERSTVEEQQARATTDVWDLGGDQTFGATRAQNQLESMVEAFRRSGSAIQAVDIGGIRAGNDIRSREAGEESLVSMSKDTGGEYFRNFNNLGEAMEKMLEQTSVTYLLTFEPQNLRLDGAYHRLKVRLKDTPRARISHRAGYYAPKPFSEIDPRRRRLETAEIMMSDEEGGPIDLAILSAAFPVPEQNAYVPVLIEVNGETLVPTEIRDTLEVEIYAYATHSETGAVYDFFVRTLGLDLKQYREALKARGLKYWGHFDLPPGRYTTRVMVRDKTDGRYTLRRQKVMVPASATSEALLLPPLFPEPPDKWMMVREGEDERREGVPYPFMVEGNPYIPAARPIVPRRGTTPFYLQGLNLVGDVRFEGEVTSAEGSPVADAKLKMTEPTAREGLHSVTAELETRGLQAGEYTLVGKATDALGVPHACEIRFEVRP